MSTKNTVSMIATRLAPTAACMSVIFVLSVRSTVPDPPGMSVDTLTMLGHFIAYGALAALLYIGLPETLLLPRRRLVLAFTGALAFGIAAEIVQLFLPHREASLLDVAIDALGATCGLLVARAIERRRWCPKALPAD